MTGIAANAKRPALTFLNSTYRAHIRGLRDSELYENSLS